MTRHPAIAAARTLTIAVILAGSSGYAAAHGSNGPVSVTLSAGAVALLPAGASGLSTPPHQHDAWTPPTSTVLPAAFVRATQTLFALGVADPRGGAYREITVRVGNVWQGDAETVTVHGWVLPAAPGEQQQRFAVGWNGLVYPAVAVGAPADLGSDVNALLADDEKRHAEFTKRAPAFPFLRMDNAHPEAYYLDAKTVLPLKASLLLRLGETKRAERVYAAWLEGLPPHVNTDDRDRADPFVRLATDWTWAKFDRAVCAHMRGDDSLALADARDLTAARATLERNPESQGSSYLSPPYQTFLKPLPDLLADSERRVAEAARPLLDLKRLRETEPDARKRIALLIARLDDVSARQSGQPGGVGLDGDPISGALIAEGDAAVDPLLGVMEKDTRLTRSVRFGRDFFYQRDLLTVRAAAYAAVCRILRTSQFSPWGPTPQVAAIRAYWEKNRDLSLPERWYNTLADDSASPRQWIEAAENIAQRTDVHRTGLLISTTPLRPDGGGALPPRRGEPLRARAGDASVSALLARRAIQTANSALAGEITSSNVYYQLADACTLGEVLAEWDPKVAGPTLARLFQACCDIEARSQNSMRVYAVQDLVSHIARLTLGRVRAGNGDAARKDYLAWVLGHGPATAGLDSFTADLLTPLWRLRDDRAWADAATQVFDQSGSPWNPAVGPGAQVHGGAFDIGSLLSSPLLSVPAFQHQIVRLLGDHTVIGSVTRRPANGPGKMTNGDVEYTMDGHGSGGRGDSLSLPGGSSEPPAAAPGTAVPLRVGDYVAWLVTSSVPGTPRFAPYWPESDRDRALTALAAFLNEQGSHITFHQGYETPLYTSDRGSASPERSFPILRAPASPEAVQAGRAVFTLADVAPSKDARRRVAPLLAPLPIRDAWWRYGASPKDIFPCTIWQAEEVREGGAWSRYYGIVAGNAVRRVPAAQMMLPTDLQAAKSAP